MIDAGPSLRAAEGLSGTTLLTYLVKRGWSVRPSRVDGVSILSKDVPGAHEPAQFILPVQSGFEDELRRVADALTTIAQVEGRTEASVAEDANQIVDAEISSQPAASRRRKGSTRKSEPADIGVETVEIVLGPRDRHQVIIRDKSGRRQTLRPSTLKFLKRASS